jgi:hypothetical protein
MYYSHRVSTQLQLTEYININNVWIMLKSPVSQNWAFIAKHVVINSESNKRFAVIGGWLVGDWWVIFNIVQKNRVCQEDVCRTAATARYNKQVVVTVWSAILVCVPMFYKKPFTCNNDTKQCRWRSVEREASYLRLFPISVLPSHCQEDHRVRG